MTPIPVEGMPDALLADRPTSLGSTASWRTQRPIILLAKCTKCGVCWKFCPDVAVEWDEAGHPTISEEHCKGCGICAHECPTDAIRMEREAD